MRITEKQIDREVKSNPGLGRLQARRQIEARNLMQRNWKYNMPK